MDGDAAQMNDPIRPTIPEQTVYPIEEDYVMVDEIELQANTSSQERARSSTSDANPVRPAKTLLQVTALAAPSLWSTPVIVTDPSPFEVLSFRQQPETSQPAAPPPHEPPLLIQNASDVYALSEEQLLEALQTYIPGWEQSEWDEIVALREGLLRIIHDKAERS
ncbi:hypothetical protein CALCODRAFT_480604 [Calocera cornea HHB12733]|uniref:Uncharacterized protein n=1 Tax=Calocera cornea HHB12733 TaxID=1353952 RepID=A0A165IFL7_9BASI|nr:hypothetical protein CALCODRAFT_480604 [Calocera cornea HHB12733]